MLNIMFHYQIHGILWHNIASILFM